jgi:uncharacterized protein (TIGR00251 family)
MEPRTIRLFLRVSPGAGRASVVGRYGDAWKVRVTAPPERGRANDDVVGLIASSVGVARPDVRLVSGASSRDKVVELTGVTVEEAERRLEAAGKEPA